MLETIFGADQSSPEARAQLTVLSSISHWYGQHNFIGNPNVLTWLLGRRPTSFAAFAAGAFTQYTEARSSVK